MKETTGLISVIIPLYNKCRTISKSIESILNQTYENYEVIVVDDGSTDGSPEIVKSFSSKKVSIIHKVNGGPASARNCGVRNSSGEWVVFLDADDCFEPNAFTIFCKLIKDNPECDFFCCNHYVDSGKTKKLYSQEYKEGYVRNSFLAWSTQRCLPRAGAALFRKTFIIEHPFNEKLKRYEDAEMLFDMMRRTKIFTCPVPVVTYNRGESQASLPCQDISDDFIGHLTLKGKSIFEQYALYQLYIEGKYLYPKQVHNLYKEKDMRTVKVRFSEYIIRIIRKTRRINLAFSLCKHNSIQ